MIGFDGLRNCSFDLVSDGDRKRKILWVERLRGAGDIDHAQQIAILRMPDGRSRTGPNANVVAEMLGSMDLHRFQRGDGRSDGIGPNVRFVPEAALFKGHKMPKIDGTRVSGGPEDETGWIREKDHRVRVG